MLNDFVTDLRKHLPAAQAVALPTEQEVAETFDRQFKAYREIEMVRLAGLPPELVEIFKNSPGLHALGSTLVQIASAGNESPVFMSPEGFANPGTYRLGEILTTLTSTVSASPKKLEAALNRLMPYDSELRARLVHQFLDLKTDATARAATLGIKPKALESYMKLAAQLRNRDRSSLVRGDRRWKELWAKTDEAVFNHNGEIAENYIQDQISRNVFDHKDADEFQLVLSEDNHGAAGVSLRKVFDAKSNSTKSILRVDVVNGSAYLRGQKISKDEWMQKSVASSRARLRGRFIEYDVDGSHGDLSEVLSRVRTPPVRTSVRCESVAA